MHAEIDKPTFDELNSLYGERNRVVHQYIISDITTAKILAIAIRYDTVKDKVCEYIGALEAAQIRENVGMTVSSHATFGELLSFAKEKHGDDDLAKRMRS